MPPIRDTISRNSSIILKTFAARNKFQDVYLAYLASVLFLLRLEKEKNTDARIKEVYDSYETSLQSAVKVTPRSYFHAQLFLSILSSLELFFQEVVSAVLKAFPKKIGSAQFKLSEILDAESTDDLVTRAAEEHIVKLMYRKPLEYLDEITNILSIDSKELSIYWPIFIEAKARRDLGNTHNGWRCNSTYIQKLKEAEISSKLQVGDDDIPVRQWLPEQCRGYARQDLKHHYIGADENLHT